MMCLKIVYKTGKILTDKLIFHVPKMSTHLCFKNMLFLFDIHVHIYCATDHEKQKNVKRIDNYYIFIDSILNYREFILHIFVLSEYGN